MIPEFELDDIGLPRQGGNMREMVREFVDRVFNGAGRPLVVHMLEEDRISESELREITRMMGKKR